jgi:hypothetical protein
MDPYHKKLTDANDSGPNKIHLQVTIATDQYTEV